MQVGNQDACVPNPFHNRYCHLQLFHRKRYDGMELGEKVVWNWGRRNLGMALNSHLVCLHLLLDHFHLQVMGSSFFCASSTPLRPAWRVVKLVAAAPAVAGWSRSQSYTHALSHSHTTTCTYTLTNYNTCT